MSEETPKKGHKPKADHAWHYKNKELVQKSKAKKFKQPYIENNLWLFKENSSNQNLDN